MTTTFTGEVRIPGSIENGLPSTITLDAQTLVLTAGGTELGRWNRTDLKLRREADGTFHLTLGREVVLFNPDSPLEFAILSGMPGAGTAPTPAAVEPAAAPTPPANPSVPPATPAIPEPAAAVPVAPIAAVPATSSSPPQEPAAPAVTSAPPAPQPSPSTAPPAAPQPAPTTAPPEIAAPAAAQPAMAPTVAAATPAPAPAPATTPTSPGVPPQTMPAAPPASPPPAATAPPQTPGQSSPPAPAVPSAPPIESSPAQPAAAGTIAAVPGSVDIQLEPGPAGGDEAAASAAPSAPPLDPESAFPTTETQSAEPPPQAAAPRSGQTKDFWDGFYAEEQEAAGSPGQPEAMAEASAPQAPAEQASGFLLQDDREDAAEDDAGKDGGYGSGLFKDDTGDAVPPPAFGGDEPADGDDRAWSYYDDEDGERADGDRGWSYDDDPPEEAGAEGADAEEAPAFRSPAADRDELVKSARTSRFSGIAGWRPSLPSVSFGSSALGMRARDALGILDAILEENGTEDIPKSFIFGLGGFAILLGVVAVLVVLFG